MINKDIVDYIKGQIAKGSSKEEIKSALASSGWQMVDIEEAFKYTQSGIPVAPMFSNVQSSGQTEQQYSQNSAFLASPTDLLKEAWGFFKARFSIFAGITLIPIAVMIVLIIAMFFLLGVAGFLDGLFGSRVGVSPDLSLFPNILVIVTLALLFLAIMILQIWSQSALLFAIKDGAENIGVKESYRRGWHKIGSIFWIGLLSGIIVMGGYLLFVIPGIIFAVWFSLAVYIVIAEGSGGMNAILKSKEYVKGYWWEVLWRFIFIGLVVFGINIVAMIASAIIPIIPNLLMIFITPLTVIYSFLVYKNLKAIKGEVKSEFSFSEKIKFIAVGILGILLIAGFIIGSIFLASLTTDINRPKPWDARRQSDISSLQVPLTLYADDHNNFYPSTLNQLIPEYTKIIPVDPVTKLQYEYRLLKNDKDFELCAKLDSGEKKCVNSY